MKLLETNQREDLRGLACPEGIWWILSRQVQFNSRGIIDTGRIRIMSKMSEVDKNGTF